MLEISLPPIAPVTVADNPHNPIARFAEDGYRRTPVESLMPTVDYNLRVTRVVRAAASSSLAEVFELRLLVLRAEIIRLQQMRLLQQKRLFIDRSNWAISIGDGVTSYIEMGTTPTKPVYVGTPTVHSGIGQVEYYATFSVVFTRFAITPPASGGIWWLVEIQAVS